MKYYDKIIKDMTPEKLSMCHELNSEYCDDCYKLNQDCQLPCHEQLLKLFNSKVIEEDPTGIELAIDMGEKVTEDYNKYVKFIESRWCKCI